MLFKRFLKGYNALTISIVFKSLSFDVDEEQDVQPDLMFEAYQFNERSTHVKVVIYMLESDLNTLMRLEAVFAQ